MIFLYSLVVGYLVILVHGINENGEGKSPIKAWGETPTCPGESPTYEIPNYPLPKYCIEESSHCEILPQVNEETYFYTAVIHCKEKSYFVVMHRHQGWPNQRFFLDTMTVATNPFPGNRQITSSVFPVYQGSANGPVIYYKMEDKSCSRITYVLPGTFKQANIKLLDDTASDSCKAVGRVVDQFQSRDQYRNWYETNVCTSLTKKTEEVNCADIPPLKEVSLKKDAPKKQKKPKGPKAKNPHNKGSK